MKRILSWIVMAGIMIIVMNLVAIVVKLVLRGIYMIMDLSEALFWIILLLGGGSVIIGVIFGLIAMSGLAVHASEAVYPSARGGRYTAFGAVMVVLYGAALVIGIVNHAGPVANIQNGAILLSVIIFLLTAKEAGT